MDNEEPLSFMASIPFNRLVGIRLGALHDDGVTIECPVRPELLNGAGVVHGGVTATLADIAAGFSVTRNIGRIRAATTVELKVNYLRPIASGIISARCHILRMGKTLCVMRVDIEDEEHRLAGVALVTYMLIES